MIINTWGEVLSQTFRDLGTSVINFIPHLVIAILVFVLGWAIGSLLGRLVAKIIDALRVDDALRRAGVEEAVRRGGLNLNTGKFIGELVKWFIIIVFLIAVLNILGLGQVNFFLQQVVLGYLPQVIVAVLILVAAAVLGDFMQKVVTASSKTAEIKTANFLGNVAKWAIWIFAVLVALAQVGIASEFIHTLFTGFVVALSLALGLAFGLGGQETASELIKKTRRDISHHHE